MQLSVTLGACTTGLPSEPPTTQARVPTGAVLPLKERLPCGDRVTIGTLSVISEDGEHPGTVFS